MKRNRRIFVEEPKNKTPLFSVKKGIFVLKKKEREGKNGWKKIKKMEKKREKSRWLVEKIFGWLKLLLKMRLRRILRIFRANFS